MVEVFEDLFVGCRISGAVRQEVWLERVFGEGLESVFKGVRARRGCDY